MKVHSNFDLTNFNSYRVKARCSTAYFPENEEDVIEFYSSKKPFILLGSGHNIILSKDYYDTNFLIFNGNFDDLEINAETGDIVAEAGITMLEISKSALENGLTGVEIFYDIPSSLGGAVVMNAGASGEEIKDVLVKVRYLDLVDMKVKEIRKEEMGFEYRNSFFQRNTDKVVLKVWLQLLIGSKDAIKDKMETIKSQRWAKQPKEFPNAGSVFKRPKGYYVGAIMDELKLKGYTIGGAKISEKHGGFIVNFDNATGNDILQIIKEVKSKVLESFGVDLEIEQRII
ncbi:UDP-N-acetylmuramate dehydrogenase [Aurantibacter crassamenti]|uniref:UDP-N-acetylmuramate dehydrogenase n=1 Tax=Aurantibacter crassamenti TaxID=1837375 RepID=UPI00193A8007|nr:UDP-N-acetylmuramate dehydrogenase [Aurantibacter crassamenti]MBM1106762.1 UDP-N-acetylmuramate dehydrogenase [Aurantibacter crassamenti]